MEKRSIKNTRRSYLEQRMRAERLIEFVLLIVLVVFSVCAVISIVTGARSTAFEGFGLITFCFIVAWLVKKA
jgi:hypothetical protein